MNHLCSFEANYFPSALTYLHLALHCCSLSPPPLLTHGCYLASSPHCRYLIPSLSQERILGPLFQAIIGEDMVVPMCGVVLNLPDSENQSFHRDSQHLFEAQMPCHAFVVFLPLVPMVEVLADRSICVYIKVVCGRRTGLHTSNLALTRGPAKLTVSVVGLLQSNPMHLFCAPV